MRRILTRGLLVGASAIGVVVVATRDTPIARVVGRVGRELERRSRYVRHAWPGFRYRLLGRHPALDVSDDVLADRVRSSLGPLEHRLDVPRVKVAVHNGIAVLHGAVPTHVDAHEIELAAHRVAGVRGIESYLHPSLDAGEQRPSEARSTTRSAAYTAFIEAVKRAGAPGGERERCVRAVLGPFMERLPHDEREHVLAHLPADARALAEPARRHGASRLRTLDELDDEVATIGGVDPLVADAVTDEVLATLRTLVPEEITDVAAVLPSGLRAAWERAAHAG